MPPPTPSPWIAEVAHTAHSAAMYRAAESARPDALFRDPLAARLAGERGAAIAAGRAKRDPLSWFFVARTHLHDRLLAEELRRGADRVLVLGAGLDARPFRLPLPGGLRWIEADLPGLIAEKERTLAGERPCCAVERVAIDLTDRAARRELMARVARGARRAIAISEGLLIYLEADEVAVLAGDLRAAGFAAWHYELTTPAALRRARRTTGRHPGESPLAFRFAPAAGAAFFAAHGWHERTRLSTHHLAARARRGPPSLRLLALLGERSPLLRFLPWTWVCAAEPAAAAAG